MPEDTLGIVTLCGGILDGRQIYLPMGCAGTLYRSPLGYLHVYLRRHNDPYRLIRMVWRLSLEPARQPGTERFFAEAKFVPFPEECP
jgi:hypothetical protein